MSMRNAPSSRRHRPRNAMRPGLIAAFAGLLLVAAPTLAHKLNVFAAADGRVILGEVYFAGGAPAVGLDVLVQDASGAPLAQSQTDAEGAFKVEATAPVDHVLVVETADGHRAEWRIGADELAGGFAARSDSTNTGPSDQPKVPATASPADRDSPVPDVAPGAAETSSSTASVSAPQLVPQPAPAADQALDPALLAAIERAVARQVRPLRKETLAAREAARLRDVLGGLGYILGLTGLGLWWHCRRDRGIDRRRWS
jgi:nickel transport protein